MKSLETSNVHCTRFVWADDIHGIVSIAVNEPGGVESISSDDVDEIGSIMEESTTWDWVRTLPTIQS